MTGINAFFQDAFQALTDFVPMQWQCRLYSQMMRSELPKSIDLPTGLGKTSIIPIWLIALASMTGDESVRLPRRLIYIVNRRTVVDQTTDVVKKIRARLLDPSNQDWAAHSQVLVRLVGGLRKLSSGFDDLPIAISTLRGELADNDEWKIDPARPAIIVGTIDMIGSKLLFSGYGDGRYYRPHNAGLIGQDSLIVHDEAHLTPAFSDLLHRVAEVQHCSNELLPVDVVELSATLRNNISSDFKLEADEEDQIVKDRMDAKKRLFLHEVGEDGLIEKLVELSKAHDQEQARVLIYVISPEDAQSVVDQLQKQLDNSEDRIALLTGTIRGYERDQIVGQNPVYRALLNSESELGQTVYMVSTSAGEVGIDLNADHLVCDMTTLDSMIQRLGRVNRRGSREHEARVDVVGIHRAQVESTDMAKAIKATSDLFRRLYDSSGGEIDVGPRNLYALVRGLGEEEREAAFSPKPTAPPLTDILLDNWSMTSISSSMPGRPGVTEYLHGLTDDPPETYLAWRKEVARLSEAQADPVGLRDWFLSCRIRAHELLRERTDRVKRALKILLKAHRTQDESHDFPVVLLDELGNAELSLLSRIIRDDNDLAYRTIVLPCEAGGLNQYGMLDPKARGEALDVAEKEISGERRERWLDENGQQFRNLITDEVAESLPPDLKEQERITLKQSFEGAEDGTSLHLVLVVQPAHLGLENPEAIKVKQTLEDHCRRVVTCVNRISDALELSPSLRDALAVAAEHHDTGKGRPIWQKFAFNDDLDVPLAKSVKYRPGHFLGGYRHEFGSLLEATKKEEIQCYLEADLILHLIAAHHGWARPHFERKALDNTRTTLENEETSADVLRRFGRVQQRFGRWSLAWMEALLRCADMIASEQYNEVSIIKAPWEADK